MLKKEWLRQVQALSGSKAKTCDKVIDAFFETIIADLGDYDKFHTPIGKIAIRSKFNKTESKFNGGVVPAGYIYYLTFRPTALTKESIKIYR